MANKTKCLTPGTRFYTKITTKSISIYISFPTHIDINKKEATILETLLHNSIETVLRPYFMKPKQSKRKT
jgi:hypothetical protein